MASCQLCNAENYSAGIHCYRCEAAIQGGGHAFAHREAERDGRLPPSILSHREVLRHNPRKHIETYNHRVAEGYETFGWREDFINY